MNLVCVDPIKVPAHPAQRPYYRCCDFDRISVPVKVLSTPPGTTPLAVGGLTMSEQSTPAPDDGQHVPRFRPYIGHRRIHSQGYILIYVGRDHHLADTHGYAYEHRLAVEAQLGRRLLPGEEVHHVDENPANNDPSNLELKGSHAEHFVEHRKTRKGLRMPYELNPVIPCECGCGGTLKKYDSEGRPRRYLSSHQRKPHQDTVRAALRVRPLAFSPLAKATGIARNTLSVCLQRMKRKGLVTLVGDVWHLI